MVYFAVFWGNAPPATNGISKVHSPREMVLKRSVDFNLHRRGRFGQYVHAHIEPDATNDMRGRTFAGLYLGPTGNLQGTVKVWDLHTGHVKKVKKFDVVPMPDRTVKKVNDWGLRYQKEKKKKMAKFLDRLKREFAWENDEYMPPEEELVHPEITAEFPGIVMDEKDEDCDMALEDHDENEEEQIRRVSQTTGVQAHGAGTTGVQGTLGMDPTTIFVLPQNANNEGEDDNEDETVDPPEEEEDNDSDGEDTTPGNPIPEENVEDDDGEQDEVLPDVPAPQGEDTEAQGAEVDDEGVRRSIRQRTAPGSYIPNNRGKLINIRGQ